MKKINIILTIILSIFLMSCTQKNTDIQIEVINNSDSIIEGSFYESNQKIGQPLVLEPLEKYNIIFTKKELVDSFDSRDFETGNLILILNTPDTVKIMLTGYITHGHNDLSGRFTTVTINKDFSYGIINKDL